MTTLTDTQSIILSAAAQRADRIALPLPTNLRGGAATKVVGTMLAKGLLEEVDADPRKRELIWRETGDGHGVTLVATNAGLDTIGVEHEAGSANAAPLGAPDAPTDEPVAHAAVTGAAPTSRAPLEGTKQAALIDMLSRPEGATIEEIATGLQWAPHTVRGAMSGALKKRLGLVITSQKDIQRGRIYQILQSI
ncbi:MAG: DUF3489 domain-containing protein [Marivita sp.]|uniref:DUF3489 domain-containing protein n=1 Tax=Marivita sp. TaxID=2003365 RepID=UPI001B12B7B9|nr:DUF3489 domain-containing protein [Marivita sp.]MBO6885371.1 DUF3489 domain-containing protein [Marivita sp.]